MSDVIATQGEPTLRNVAAAAKKTGATPRTPKRKPGRDREWLSALLFLSPTLVVFSAFILFPLVFSFYLSFHEWNMFSGQREFIGIANYTQMFGDPEFWRVFRHTVVYTVGTVPVNMALALFVAFILNGKIRGKKLLRTAFFTPVIISSVAAAVIWRWIFDPNLGVLNHVLGLVGVDPINWMNDTSAAMSALIIVGVWKTFGINMILFAAGLSGIPDHYYEAAEIDGAGPWAKFWRITVPLLSPTTLFIMVLSIIGSFQVFDLVYVLTYGGPLGSTKVLVFYLYEHGFRFFNMGYASAVAYLLFFVLFILTMIQIRFFKDQVYDAA